LVMRDGLDPIEREEEARQQQSQKT